MAEQYVLKVKVDDADIRKLEKRLAGILTGKGITGGSGSGGNGALGKNLAKLGIIATGVVGILALTKKLTGMLVDSSPMLKQMLKLFNFSIMLIFRPIGDFIGFLLRPIMVMFLRKFIIPWYTTAMPVMTKVGSFVGEFIAKLMGEDGIVGIATSLGVIGVALTAGIGLTVASVKVAGGILANMMSAGGKMAGTSFSKTSVGGFKADATWKKFKAQITSLKSAFKFPKPAWVTGFQSILSRFINLINPKTPYTGTGIGGFGQTATVTKNSSSFQKTGAMGAGGKSSAGLPDHIKKLLHGKGYASSAAAKTGNIKPNWKLPKLPVSGIGANAGLMLLTMMGEQQAGGNNPNTIREQRAQSGDGYQAFQTILEDIRATVTNTQNKNNIIINIGSIHEKSNVDHLQNMLEAVNHK